MSLIIGHFTRLYATWSGLLKYSDMQTLDQEASQAINGDDGGTWAPASQITFSGATNGLQVTGPVTVFQGPNSGAAGSTGFLMTQGPGSPQFRYVGPGFPNLLPGHAGRTRTLGTLLAPAVATPSYGAAPAILNGACNGGVQTNAGAYSQEAGGITQLTQGATTSSGVELVQELRVHNGATLSQVVLNFLVPLPHAAVPTLPKARILRCDAYGNTVPLTSTASGADGNGYVSPTAPSSGAAWYNLGAAQSWTIPCDQNNVIDITQFYYVIDIIEELTGTVVPVLAPVDACTTSTDGAGNGQVSPSGAGVVTIDGRTVTAGNRYLLTHQANPRQNGPWIAQTGPWIRPDDWAFGSTGPAYATVPIQNGAQFHGTQQQLQGGASVTIGGYPAWGPVRTYAVGQIVVPSSEIGWAYVCLIAGTSGSSDPTASWPTGQGAQVTDGTVTWGAVKDPSSTATFGTPVPLGNVWLSAVGTFTNITTLAFQ